MSKNSISVRVPVEGTIRYGELHVAVDEKLGMIITVVDERGAPLGTQIHFHISQTEKVCEMLRASALSFAQAKLEDAERLMAFVGGSVPDVHA
jgi:uncharacterized protein YggE